MNRGIRGLVSAVLGGLAVLPACGQPLERGGPAPPLSSLVTIPVPGVPSGESRPASGHVRLIEFWSTYCAPCRESIPELNRMHEELASRGLEIVAVTQEDVEHVLPYVRENGIRYPVYSDPSGEVHRSYGVTGAPLAFLVDAENRVVWSGSPASGEMQSVLQTLLQEM